MASREPDNGRYATAYAPGPGPAERLERAVRTPETKEFFRSSEFFVWGVTSLVLLIAAALVTGDADHFIAKDAWMYVTILSAAYIISRGIAKAGTRRGHEHERY